MLKGANFTSVQFQTIGESMEDTKIVQFSTFSNKIRRQAVVIVEFLIFLSKTVPEQGPNRRQGQSDMFSAVIVSELIILREDSRKMLTRLRQRPMKEWEAN